MNTTTEATQSSFSKQIQTSASHESRAKFGTDFENFLKLLVTQLQNQDPLSPLESHEFTNQLVMFAGVEQQIRGNELSEQLVKAESRRILSDGLNFIGKKVNYGNEFFEFDEKGNMKLEFKSPQDVSNVRLQIYDDKDSFVTQLDTGAVKEGRATHIWDGRVLSANGVELLRHQNGKFKLKILDAIDKQGKVISGGNFSVENIASGIASSVSIKNDEAFVNLRDGKQISISQVSYIGEDSQDKLKTPLELADDLNRASNLIGKTVVYRSSTIPLEEDGVDSSGNKKYKAEFSYNVPGEANVGTVYVTDLKGRLMHINNLPLTPRADGKQQTGSYTWNGMAYKYGSDGKRVYVKDASGKDTTVPEKELAPEGEYIFYINKLEKQGADAKKYTASDFSYNLPTREGEVTASEILEGRSVVLKIGATPVLLEGLIQVKK